MQYPLISEYVWSIANSQDNLEALSHLVPVLDCNGEPLHSSGAFAVVFKMKDINTGNCYALKCFTEDQNKREESYEKISEELSHVESSYVIRVNDYNNEIFVNSSCTTETEFPVLLMDWVEGATMESYIFSNYKNQSAMKWLAYRFCRMASWLRSQQFAHGDIKPDNIMVGTKGNLVLIDYDGMYVPTMKGQKSPTLGARDFSHPLRNITDFNETIDDFSLASMALSLKLLSIDSNLYATFATSDGSLFRRSDYLNLANSKIFSVIHKYLDDKDLCKLYANFLAAYAQKDLSLHSFRNFLISRP